MGGGGGGVVFQTNYLVTPTWVEVGLDLIEFKLGWVVTINAGEKLTFECIYHCVAV